MTVKLEAHTISATYGLTRSDSTAVKMFTVPANATIVSLTLTVGTASNAGTSATVTVGKTASTHEYLNAIDVTATGVTDCIVVGDVGTSDQAVYGIYAETGTASTTGGPFTVTCQYIEA